jgi:hypothetical protein
VLSVYSAESTGFATEKKNKSKLFTIQTFGIATKRLQVEDLPELTNLPLGELGAIRDDFDVLVHNALETSSKASGYSVYGRNCSTKWAKWPSEDDVT